MVYIMDRIEMKKQERLGFFDTKSLDYTRIGSFRKLHVYVDQSIEGYLDVEVVDPTVHHGRSSQRVKRVLWIQLSMTKFKAFHIDMTKLDKTYAGRGIAAQAYRYIIKKLDITLQAGSAQSKGGRKIWFDLAQTMDLAVHAQSRYSKKYEVGIDTEEREVWLPGKEIYDGLKEMYVFASVWR